MMTTTHLTTMGIVCLLAFGKCPWWPPADDGDDGGDASDTDLDVDESCTWDVDNLSFPIHVWTGPAVYGEITFDGNCDLIVGGGEELPYVDALYRVNKDDGSVSVAVAIEDLHPDSLFIAAMTYRASDNRIYFVDGLADQPADILYAVDDQNVAHAILEVEDPVLSLTVAPEDFGEFGDQLIAASGSAFSTPQLLALDPDNAVITPIVDLGATVVTFGPDGTLYAAQFGENRVVTVTADGVITPFCTDLDRPRGLAFSPDGNQMFVAHQPGGAGRLDQISLPDMTLTPGVPIEFGGAPVGVVVDGANNVLYEMPFDDYSYAGIGMFAAP
jgi:hypothetical protein